MKDIIENNSDEYYLSAFEKLEKEKKHTWNLAAFFLGGDWLLYKKMYACHLTATLILGFVIGFISGFIGAAYGAEAIAQIGAEQLKAIGICVGLFGRLVVGIVIGRYGNELYYKNIRKKIRMGYHLSGKYQPNFIFIAAFSFFGGLLIIYSPSAIIYCTISLFIYIPMLVMYINDKRTLKKMTAPNTAFDNAINKKNILAVISKKQ